HRVGHDLVAQAVVQAAHGIPAAAALAAAGPEVLALVAPQVVQRPLPAHVDRLVAHAVGRDAVGLVAVRGAERAVGPRRVAGGDGAAIGAALVRVVLDGGVQAPLGTQVDLCAQQQVAGPLDHR